jgi:hypothetical protein
VDEEIGVLCGEDSCRARPCVTGNYDLSSRSSLTDQDRRGYDLAVLEGDRLASVNSPPEGSFRNAELGSELRVEPAFAFLLGYHTSEAGWTPMIQRKGMDEIALTGNGVTGHEFANFESE